MRAPVRLQLYRRKGFNLQAWSREVNGLPAVNVSRSGKWGNPYKVGVDGSAAHCVACFRLFTERPARKLTNWPERMRAALAGRNLACWCALDGTPCHADVLLELANATPTEPRP